MAALTSKTKKMSEVNKHVQSSVHQLVGDFSGPTTQIPNDVTSRALTLAELRSKAMFQGIDIAEN